MATVPVTRTFVAGEVVLASHFNTNIRDVLNYLLAPPLLEVRQIVAQTFTTGVTAALTFTGEDVDTSGMHSTSTNTDRATAVYPGYYQGSGGVIFNANTTGIRHQFLGVNGAIVVASATSRPGSTLAGAEAIRTKKVFLNVNDYMQVMAIQDSGGNLATYVAVADYQSGMSAEWVSN